MDLVGYVLGARVIEKHFTLNRANKGTDNSFSLEPQGLQKLVRDIERARVAIGDGKKRVYESEKQPILKMRKKIVYSRDLKAGHILSLADLEFKSPGDALPPYRINECISQTLSEDVFTDQDVCIDQFLSAGYIIKHGRYHCVNGKFEKVLNEERRGDPSRIHPCQILILT